VIVLKLEFVVFKIIIGNDKSYKALLYYSSSVSRITRNITINLRKGFIRLLILSTQLYISFGEKRVSKL
jgi:hypothetical protein